MLIRTTLVLSVVVAHLAWAEREHKVHNIILYPEKHSWCQTTPIQQVVASPGYEPATIDNNVCVGACFSYSIPKTQPAEPGELIGPYCDSCQPAETKCYHVTLHADAKNTEGPRTFQKRVQIIMNCSCMSCEKPSSEARDCEISDPNTLELPLDLFSNRTRAEPGRSKIATEEVPELLHLTPPLDFGGQSNKPEDASNSKKQLKDLLKDIKSTSGGDVENNSDDFVDFVNNRYSEDMELDVGRLKEVLKAYRKNKNSVLEKHREFGLGLLGQNNADIEKDLENLPKNFGLEGIVPSAAQGAAAAAPNAITEEPKVLHRLGDELHAGLDVGHLVKGPHGSMVLAPDIKVEEKLNIDSDILKPNHDGVVIAYENHNKNKVVVD